MNCDKKPNIIGKDRFAVALHRNGALVEHSTSEYFDDYPDWCAREQKAIAKGDFERNLYASSLEYCSIPVIADGFNIK